MRDDHRLPDLASLPTQSQQRPDPDPHHDPFDNHVQRLLFCLTWCDVFPRPLLAQWKSHVEALDRLRPRESLRLLAALSASFDEARGLFEPRARDLFPAMRFSEQAPRIAREIHLLIQFLERTVASAVG